MDACTEPTTLDTGSPVPRSAIPSARDRRVFAGQRPLPLHWLRGAAPSQFVTLLLSTSGLLFACGDGDRIGNPRAAGGTSTGDASERHILCGTGGSAQTGGTAQSTGGASITADTGGAAQNTGGASPTSGTGGAAASGGTPAPLSGGQPASGGAETGLATGGDGQTSTPEPLVELLGPPMVFAPTATSFSVNAVVANGNADRLTAIVQEDGSSERQGNAGVGYPTADTIEWTCGGLEPGKRYQYQIISRRSDGGQTVLFTGSATTQRPAGEAFTFSLLTDTHISPHEDPVESYEVYAAATTPQVARDIAESNPDFIVHLGDVLDFHRFGFGLPPPDASWTRLGYMVYRELMGEPLGNAAHFSMIGTWDGENGYFTDEQIGFSRAARHAYLPGPDATTYPEQGSEYGDYYAFTWGDALFIVLNVESYTTSPHRLSWDPGVPDDWTLGEAQLEWFRATLEAATSRWRFVMIHHPVGGNAGNSEDTAYGRGGGLTAYFGEQATVHELMRQYGVQIFFYGHDHVFTDMIVDDIHYTLPGSAGAPTNWMFDTYNTGYPEGSYVKQSGHGRVEVSTDQVHVSFLGLGNELLYEYTLTQ